MLRLALLALLLTPPAASTGASPPIEFARHTLKNGLEVLVVENHALPLVTIEIAAHNGSMTEPPDYNGLSHLYEHMFFKANAVIPNQEAYLARTRELGMQWNGTTNTERVNYFFTTTTDHLADAMVFMRDAIVSPLFDPKELERERVVVTGEIDRNEATPGYHFWHQVTRRVFWKYPSRKDPLGDRKTVLAATREQMQTIKQRYYVPNNSLLVVTGDVRAADIFAQADTLYASWKRGPDPFRAHRLVKHPSIPERSVVLVEQPVQTVTGSLNWHGPSTVGDDVEMTYAADVLGLALAEPSSRFQKALVDSGACVAASLSWLTQRNLGPITLSFEATPDKVDDCVRAAQSELRRIREPDYLSDDEMANAVHRLEVGQALERERPSAYAHALTFWWCSASLDYYVHYVENARKVSHRAIAQFVNRYVLARPYVLGIMVSPEMIRERGLDQGHFEGLLRMRPSKEAAR
ncbi:MAG TPA: pitrilysin family protein [Polyangia bacterium]|nr:pitrilysin family protein [Polyangia bacterium]